MQGLAEPSLFPPALPRLSIVIIGRNEGDRLERCILTAQAVEGWKSNEILYVDSGSTDGSVELDGAAAGGRDVGGGRAPGGTVAGGPGGGGATPITGMAV